MKQYARKKRKVSERRRRRRKQRKIGKTKEKANEDVERITYHAVL